MLQSPITYMDTIYAHRKESCYSKYLQEWAAGIGLDLIWSEDCLKDRPKWWNLIII